ncbi:endonuclease SmrB [Pseudidiomarina taiwanensis]|uniref:Ribosome rescue factor SmrB n=1 Tax=Pseudidiomarina taiwanensis TaxID=337250 RepID=A0A432ZNT0_9GAMM|nr:endonuclease SmrB [Pseudidiomarina taiwanensis]RUO79533.1 endonuclease SmrB [Pseudidiomarina taiwanensis]
MNDESDELELFRQAVKVDKRVQADTVEPVRAKPASAPVRQRHQQRQQSASVQFSDDYRAHFAEGPVRYVAEGDDPSLARQLRRGQHVPDLILDLHGLTRAQAALELQALIDSCYRQDVSCCSVMHGYGSGVLKQQVPHWLVQHPLVRAFHQAPREFGGDAALLVLVRTKSSESLAL